MADEQNIIRETTYKQPASREETPAIETVRAELQDINAETVLMNRSGSETITANRVVMERSGTKSIEAKSAQLDRSGVLALGSDNTVLLNSQALQVVADEARISRSKVVALFSEKASLEDSKVVIFSGNADGDVNTVFTPTSAAIAGAAFAGVLGFLLVLLRIVGSRK